MNRGQPESNNPRLPTGLRLLTWIGTLWRGMALSVVLGVLTIASSIGLIAVSAWMISKAALQPSIADLGVSVVAVRFFGISRGVFRYLERLVSHDTTFRLLARLRVRFYDAIEPLAPAVFMRYQSGDLLARMLSDIETLQNVFLRAISPAMVALLTVILVFVLLFAFDGLVALVALGFMALTGTLIPLAAWWTGKRQSAELVTTRAALNQALVEGIQGLADSLAYGRMPDQLATLDNFNRQVAARERYFAGLDGLQQGLTILLVNGAALAVLAAAISRVEGIYLATITLAVVAAFEPLMPLGLVTSHAGSDAAAARRLFEIMDAAPATVDPPAPLPVPSAYSLIFDDVTFRYSENDPPALDHFSLEIGQGKRVAIVGPSGSGKSTLVNLLLRFWDYQAGQISLGGQDLRSLAQADVRQIFGVMTQRTHLFDTTIMENICIGRSGASDEEVIQAAKKAQLHDFIQTLPEKYDTLVGEEGARLSGGEAQRIALARVLLKDAPIYLLDEATANLDVMTEKALLQSIFEVTAGKTLILLTHRRVFLDRMDQVIRLADGKVVGSS